MVGKTGRSEVLVLHCLVTIKPPSQGQDIQVNSLYYSAFSYRGSKTHQIQDMGKVEQSQSLKQNSFFCVDHWPTLGQQVLRLIHDHTFFPREFGGL
jgi:hypothetical protein